MLSAVTVLDALVARLAALPLDAAADSAGEPLFHTVATWPNKRLPEALQKLIIAKNRICLVVPLSRRRVVRDTSGALSVLGYTYLDAALIYTDRAYYQGETRTTFGGDANLGLLTVAERIEAALTGVDLTEAGGIVFDDDEPIVLSDSEQAAAPGRQAWMQLLSLPLGPFAYEVA